MFRVEPVASTYLDIAEKSRAYNRHMNALISNPHNSLTTPPTISPCVIAFEKRRKYERNFMINDEKKHSMKINEIWKRAHGYEIRNDISHLKPKLRTREFARSWSSSLKDCEIDFPNKDELAKMKSNKTETFSTGYGEMDDNTVSPVKGMKVDYSSYSSKSESSKSKIESNDTITE